VKLAHRRRQEFPGRFVETEALGDARQLTEGGGERTGVSNGGDGIRRNGSVCTHAKKNCEIVAATKSRRYRVFRLPLPFILKGTFHAVTARDGPNADWQAFDDGPGFAQFSSEITQRRPHMDIPISVRNEFDASEALDQHITKRLEGALRSHERFVQKVEIRLSDANGPRKGPGDKVTLIEVALRPFGEIVARAEDEDIYKSYQLGVSS
jgi:hypothetical protein